MAGSPTNEIMQMRQQGLSNNQIIQNLQRAGYSNTQIFDAMNQVDTKMAVEGMQPFFTQPEVQFPGQQNNEVVFSTPSTGMPVMDVRQQQQAPMQPPPPAQMQQDPFQNQVFQDNQVKMQELIEAIIEEKWEELLKDVNKIVAWKNKIDGRLSEIEMSLDHLKESFTDLQKAIVGKVNDYDKHIMEVGSELKAMEKVFSKMLPVFAENVNELSNIANKLKEDEK